MTREFIGIDGEAIDGTYCLLGTNANRCLENRKGIKTLEALNFIYALGHHNQKRNLHRTFVGFYFNYDVEMIMRDLPSRLKLKLFRGEKVVWNRFRLHYAKKKFLRVRDVEGKKGTTIYDVCGFFQGIGSFIRVLEEMKIPVPQEIREGKASRAKFSWKDFETIKSYNHIECEKLTELMTLIESMLTKLDLVPRSWHGSSALANLILKRAECRRFYGPDWLAIPFRSAYFGGRIEAHKLGSFQKPVYEIDINSAYPHALTQLPDITNQSYWWQVSGLKENVASIYRVQFDFRNCFNGSNGNACGHHKRENFGIGIFPFREKSGAIRYPLAGEGWYWQPEVKLAIQLCSRSVSIVEGWECDAESRHPIGKEIARIYKARLQFKQSGDLRHWLLKIALNSLYGKFAQQVGSAAYQNLPIAGLITSLTRARLRRAIIGNEENCVAFATDAIYSTKRLKVKLGNGLGDWSEEKYHNGTIVMSGVYLFDNGKKQKGGSRGFGHLEDKWKLIITQLNRHRRVEIKSSIFVGFLLSWAMPDAFGEHYLEFIPHSKNINPAGLLKRHYDFKQIKDWSKDNCDSLPLEICQGLSQPIRLKDRNKLDEDDIIFENEEGEL